MPKARREKAEAGKAVRHNPLADQILEEEGKAGLRTIPRSKQRKATKDNDKEEADAMPPGLSQKIMEIAQQQKSAEDDFDGLCDEEGSLKGLDQAEVDDEVLDVEVDEDGYVVTQVATEEEERALSLFLPSKGDKPAGLTLGDVILQKIQEHEVRKQRIADKESTGDEAGMSPKVIQVYSDIGKWLKTYKTGKIPKAFKVIPSLVNWEEVVALTSPLTWSPNAMYEAVAVFASNFNPRMAQRFFNLVLLPAVRQDIADHKKLNFHYFRALRKATFKPAAFFKGIVLPWASGNCTLREAQILSAVLAKASIPPMHSAATIARLCMMTPWYGTTAIILAALVNKKYALPMRVIDGLVLHFCAFVGEDQALPLVWHKALLIFVQRYKFELSDDQKRRLREVLRVHFHEAVGPEVRRELQASRPGEVAPTAAASAEMDEG